MGDFVLANQLRNLWTSGASLLWLEGSRHHHVTSIRLASKGKLVLELDGAITRMMHYDRYVVTAVGLQFWNRGHPGVLYKWEQVPRKTDFN